MSAGSIKSFRAVIAVFIMLSPTYLLRRFLYNTLLNYDIDSNSFVAPFVLLVGQRVKMRSAKISLFNFISVHSLSMKQASKIGKFNRIIGAHKVELDSYSFLLQNNFIGGTWGTPHQNGIEDLYLGERSQITIGAFVDLNDRVMFGNDVVAGGVGSQFWTHGFDHNRNRITGPITISDRVFIGSSTIVVPNVSICSDVTIGAGTTVHRTISEPGLYVSSELVKKA